MVLATLVLVFALPQMGDTAKAVNNLPAVSSDSTTKDSTLVASAALPLAPTPKVKTDAESIGLSPAAEPLHPLKPAVLQGPHETPRQRKIWYGLAIAGSSGAAFDAWSTHRAVAGGYGQEANPFLRPFAGSNAIYAATQVSPLVMDFLGKQMMMSQHRWVRKMWWLPQSAGASFSFVSGIHNVGVVHH